jgi:hypothetical protein
VGGGVYFEMIALGGFTKVRQCGVSCYEESRSQLTIQSNYGLVKSQLSLPTTNNGRQLQLYTIL